MYQRFIPVILGVLAILALAVSYRIKAQRKDISMVQSEPLPFTTGDAVNALKQNSPRPAFVARVQAKVEKSQLDGLSRILGNGLSFHQQRSNVHFDEREFLAKLASSEKNLFRVISDEFKSTELLSTEISREEFYFQTKPRALLARMGMMDMLKSYCKGEVDDVSALKAKQSLRDVVELSIPRTLPEHIKKILASEKYDALENLAGCDPEQAMGAYESLSNPVLKNLLLGALREGLAKSDPSERTDAIRQVLQKYSSN